MTPCNISGDTLIAYLILINSLYLPLILYSLFKLRNRGLEKKNTVKFIVATILFSLLVTCLLSVFLNIESYRYYFYFFLIFFLNIKVFFVISSKSIVGTRR